MNQSLACNTSRLLACVAENISAISDVFGHVAVAAIWKRANNHRMLFLNLRGQPLLPMVSLLSDCLTGFSFVKDGLSQVLTQEQAQKCVYAPIPRNT